MSDIKRICDGLELDRPGWLELAQEAAKRAASMRPVHIKQVYKKCGKLNCWCVDEKNEVHGPYLYAVYTDAGRQVQKSLGRYCDPDQIEVMRSRPRPRWLDFVYTGKALAKHKAGPKSWDFQQRELNSIEFEQFYGLPMEEDGLNRPRSLTYNYVEFEKAMNEHILENEIVWSSFSQFGVCTSKGHSTLKTLVARGYYLAD